jgi:hypothetical protein
VTSCARPGCDRPVNPGRRYCSRRCGATLGGHGKGLPDPSTTPAGRLVLRAVENRLAIEQASALLAMHAISPLGSDAKVLAAVTAILTCAPAAVAAKDRAA